MCATTSSHIPFDSSRPPESNETLADLIWRLVVELPLLLVGSPGGVATESSIVTATGGPQPEPYTIRFLLSTGF